jgi:hypothetical protein
VKYRIIGTGALAVIALTTTGAASCGSSGGATVNQASSPAPSSSTAPAAAAAHAGAALNLTGSSSGEKVQVTLVKVVDPSSPASQFTVPPAGMREVALELRYKNVGSAAYSTSILTNVTVQDAASHSYSIDISGDTTAGPGFPSDLINIAPGESADGFVTFQVPTATPVTQVKLSLDTFGGGDQGEWLVP